MRLTNLSKTLKPWRRRPNLGNPWALKINWQYLLRIVGKLRTGKTITLMTRNISKRQKIWTRRLRWKSMLRKKESSQIVTTYPRAKCFLWATRIRRRTRTATTTSLSGRPATIMSWVRPPTTSGTMLTEWSSSIEWLNNPSGRSTRIWWWYSQTCATIRNRVPLAPQSLRLVIRLMSKRTWDMVLRSLKCSRP